MGTRIVVSLLTDVSRTLSLNPLESFDASVTRSGAFLMPTESLVNMALGSEPDGGENLYPEKKNAFRVTTMIPSKMRRFPRTELTLENMDVPFGFTNGLERTVNCPKA